MVCDLVARMEAKASCLSRASPLYVILERREKLILLAPQRE